jgi:UDP-galactopyranose mutase
MHAFDIVCLSHLRWDFVYQRPQHLLSRAAKDRRVFYVEEPLYDAGAERMEVTETDDGVLVAVPHLPYGLDGREAEAAQSRLLAGLVAEWELDDYVLWLYTPMAMAFVDRLEPLAVVWDCMDELSAFAAAPPELARREEQLLSRADLVFTGGRSLYEAKRDRHPAVYVFPSSVDVAHFAQARAPLPDPSDQRAIPRPRLGFYGVLDERLDRDLIAQVADLRPEWQLVLVGPVTKIDAGDLPRRRNIHYLGAKSYDELPAYLAGWDVALMPFAINEATRFISPTKTPEYLTGGKPVVSTPIADVIATYGSDGPVQIAETAEAFVAACETALAVEPADRLRSIDAMLPEVDWDRTWARMLELIEGAVDVSREPVVRAAERLTVQQRGFDYLVVGAGFAGSVVAERLASQHGARVLVVDRRDHIGGNAYDHYDDAGVLVHRYGPHIFHTNSRAVWDYLSAFTSWRRYEHRVVASVDGMLVPIPINLETINALYGLNLDSFGVERFLADVAEPVARKRTSEDVVVSAVGRELYEKFFRGYTQKQWGLDPSELDASVTARVPTRTNRDCRYFTDTYQAMPRHGYTRMFERMLAHPNISVMLQTDYRDVEAFIPYRELVYSGPIDEFFDLRFGKLPYRSLDFEFETYDQEWFQPAPVVNYPNEHPYTRVTEFKYLTGQEHARTTVVYEHPRAEGDPYYPVPRPENKELYDRYKALADATAGVHFVGRLATYKYYNMDQVAAQALALADRILEPGAARRAAAPARAAA